MNITTTNKTICTGPLRHRLVQGENKADTATFLLPAIWEGHDLLALAWKIRMTTEKDTMVEQVLTAEASVDGITIPWAIDEVFTRVDGAAWLTLVGSSADGGTVIKFTGEPISIKPSVAGGSLPPISVWEQYLNQMSASVAQAEAAAGRAEQASAHPPFIGEDGYWYAYDMETGAFVKTSAKASVPGPQGIQGPQGPIGPKGDTGKGLTTLGTYATLAALEAAITAPSPGDAYEVGTTPPYTIYIWDGVANAWRDNGTLQGPPGRDGIGIPAGGLAGQVITKTSGTDYDVTWGNGGTGPEASITAYDIILAAADWTAREGGYEQTVPIPTATALDTNILVYKPQDGAAAWTYDVRIKEKGAGVATFCALHLPEVDMAYKVTVMDASDLYVDAVAQHNQDATAHGNVNIDGNDWGDA